LVFVGNTGCAGLPRASGPRNKPGGRGELCPSIACRAVAWDRVPRSGTSTPRTSNVPLPQGRPGLSVRSGARTLRWVTRIVRLSTWALLAYVIFQIVRGELTLALFVSWLGVLVPSGAWELWYRSRSRQQRGEPASPRPESGSRLIDPVCSPMPAREVRSRSRTALATRVGGQGGTSGSGCGWPASDAWSGSWTSTWALCAGISTSTSGLEG
jgi:hypothetical protein